jgi:hypothetical protein
MMQEGMSVPSGTCRFTKPKPTTKVGGYFRSIPSGSDLSEPLSRASPSFANGKGPSVSQTVSGAATSGR